MIGTKTFSSEEEQLLSLLDENPGQYPLVSSQDPVIFHNASYERELFMEYNYDFGESEDQITSPPAYMHHSKPMKMPTTKRAPTSSFNPYCSGPLIKEPSNTRSRGNSVHMYRSESPNSKRGRPSKATSNSKMANYARNYREQKKNELSMMQLRNAELEAELRLARDENSRMKSALTNAREEIAQLKKVIDQDSQIARVVATMGQSSSSQLGFGARAGVCVHVGSLGTTVEVCKQSQFNGAFQWRLLRFRLIPRRNLLILDRLFQRLGLTIHSDEAEMYSSFTPPSLYSVAINSILDRENEIRIVLRSHVSRNVRYCGGVHGESPFQALLSNPFNILLLCLLLRLKQRKSVMSSLRRSSRKIFNVGKKYAKRFTSSSAKMRLVKLKIDKQHQQQIAESKARLEKYTRAREELHAGKSQTAIMCEGLTTEARSLRESYERQRPTVYRAIFTAFLEQDEEEEAYEDGFIGTYYY
ncbi:hypothetical protein L3Y34_018952 [Caenorhabditis briggsae]|uniref:BZIP domain-containing protein n=1 Tax=Caenorhabditis briggsae TaxID=6238 RepID=A0AAE9DPK8_CAEBR|nr:hypothetical protein L3Y34_018952 [Caenorhabditis briggsae]